MTSSCTCGMVQLTAIGEPILSNICYCDDCQNGAGQIEALPNAPAVANTDGGTGFLLYRKDRIDCSRGVSLLKSYKLEEKSATNRVVATCCNSALFMNFDDGRHWVSAYRARFHGVLPPVQMRVCTKDKRADVELPDDLPSYPGYPLRMIARLVAAWIPMLFSRRTPSSIESNAKQERLA
jgi:hypothetical protein